MQDKNPLAHYSGVLSEAAQESAASNVPASGTVALSAYLETCEQNAIVPDVGGAFASAFAAGFNLASSQAAPEERKDLVPGVMRCAKCEFQLVRKVLAVNLGDVFAGDSKTEPCPNGCGPLWPVTWKQYAEQAMDAAESMADRAFAAEKEVKQLRGELSALDAPSLRAKVMSTPLGLHGTGIGDIGIAYRAGHRAALLTAADLVTATAVTPTAAAAVSDERAAFEKEMGILPSFRRWNDTDGEYVHGQVQWMWETWQDRAALAATPAAAAPDWDGKLPAGLQRALNELRTDCKTDAVNSLEFEVRSVFEGMHTSLATVKRMHHAAQKRLELIDAAQPDPFAAAAPVVLPEWEKVRRGLTMVMLGLAGRPDCSESAIEAALDAVTEPGMPLAGLRMLAGVSAPAAQAVPSKEPSFLQRLRIEQDELSVRQRTLEAFLETPAFGMLAADDANLLRKQSSLQHALLQTLNQRIHSAAEKHLRSMRHG